MRKIAILPLIVTISCAFLSSDTTNVVRNAKEMTDHQIESAYKTSNHDIITDAVRYNFRELRWLIDSLNAETILAIRRADSAAIQRDSAKMVLLSLIAENTTLKENNTKYEREIRVMSLGPDLLYAFMVVVLGSLLAQGIFIGFVNRKFTDER